MHRWPVHRCPVIVPCPPHVPPQARIYDYLFKSEEPEETEDWLTDLNPDSEQVGRAGWWLWL